jgi:protein-disulfide isomerase
MNSPNAEVDELQIHRKRNWTATMITLIVLFLLAAFVWRVLSFVQQIRSGQIDPSNFDFKQAFTTNLRLAALPLSDQPFNVVSTDDPSLGRSDGALTIVEFADFECPHSREASLTMRELSLKYPERIRYIYRDFPISDVHPIAQKAAEAGECAAEQGRFWEYHDKLYANQSDLSVERLPEFARELGLNTQVFESCLKSGRKQQEVLLDYQDGLAAGVRGTPTFFLNGTKVEGAIPKNVLEQLISSQTD